ncbi:MAG TPA: alpha/beta hydrolase-fold protein [Flavitalea sp.]|nr:alpha/beta hydrolase-fold protein [Flavitalea sp.]
MNSSTGEYNKMNFRMEAEQIDDLMIENIELQSRYLNRTVRIDLYHTDAESENYSLLLVNDGQDLVKMNFSSVLANVKVRPLITAAIHCSEDRKNEYGMSTGADYKGSGAKAGAYEKFIISELIPFLHKHFSYIFFTDTAFAGFSLGALSAFDIAWNHPDIFSLTAVFSGSLWWRSIDKVEKDYDPWVHRMMHRQVNQSEYHEGHRFFFECGELDETEDRNKNGVIDSIDDTIDLMRILVRKGYREGKDMYYLQIPDGRHDVPSWRKAFPYFLKWAYGCKS